MKLRLRLSSMFLLINSVILLLPVAAIALLKLYDSSLIRQTENTLIAQAVMLSNIYKKNLLEAYPQLKVESYGHQLPKEYWYKEDPVLGKWRPIPAVLDLQHEILLPRAENPAESELGPDPMAWHVGQQLEDLLRETQLTTLAGMRILDMNGVIVATTGSIRGQTLLHRADVARALQGNTERVLRQREEEDTEGSFFSPISRSTNIRVYVTHPIVLEKRILGAVHLVRTPPNLYQTLYKNSDIFVYYGLLILTIATLISLFMSYAINRPIIALVSQAKKASTGTLASLEPLQHPITVEFEVLSNALVNMADRQAKRAEQIKNFASHVSHEFKTPLTSINGAVEILQHHFGKLTEREQKQFLDNIALSAQRMQLLMLQLTELAKADAIHIPTRPTELTDIIKQQLMNYRQHFQQIRVNNTRTPYPVFMNPELLTSVIGNLFENVRQHGGNEVDITLEQSAEHTTMVFSDNGPGISPANAKRIFEPFFTTAKQKGGTGLGLAILSSLMVAHQGSIRLLQSSQGCSFELVFPHFN